MKRFLLWLFPDEFVSPYRRCQCHGYRRLKADLIRSSGYGWFCTEADRDDNWLARQW